MVVHACNPSYSGGSGRRIAWTQEAEVTVSQDDTTALQPGWENETLSQKQKQKQKTNKKIGIEEKLSKKLLFGDCIISYIYKNTQYIQICLN